MNDCNAQKASTPKSAVQRQWEFQQMGQMSARSLTWGLTPFKSIADAQAMDRQYDGS